MYAQNVDHRDGKQPLIALCYVPTSLQNRYYGVDVDSEEVANARLIAAAPELLEALENCLGFVVAHPQFTEDLRNLIAKARGES